MSYEERIIKTTDVIVVSYGAGDLSVDGVLHSLTIDGQSVLIDVEIEASNVSDIQDVVTWHGKGNFSHTGGSITGSNLSTNEFDGSTANISAFYMSTISTDDVDLIMSVTGSGSFRVRVRAEITVLT